VTSLKSRPSRCDRGREEEKGKLAARPGRRITQIKKHEELVLRCAFNRPARGGTGGEKKSEAEDTRSNVRFNGLQEGGNIWEADSVTEHRKRSVAGSSICGKRKRGLIEDGGGGKRKVCWALQG